MRKSGLILILLIAACSDQGVGVEDAGQPVLILPDATGDVLVLDVDVGDTGPHTGPEYDYQQKCWRTQLWFCPESFHADNMALYRIEVVIDICDASGEPCTPEVPPIETCVWNVISQGQCTEVFECNPDPNINPFLGMVDCEVEQDSGPMNGQAPLWCNKGQLYTGPCEPCTEEICDGLDNDCDGDTDEGQYPCESECGPGMGACMEGEILLCDAPLSQDEACNDFDDDCDGEIDEDLIEGCNTLCEDGHKVCFTGQWGPCSAQQPFEEACNGLDDDCDGLVDEDLNCACPPELVGVLMPCMEEPLICGQGWKTCECQDEACTETSMTECHAFCFYIPTPGEVCDDLLGVPMDEVCNGFDDDCDDLIDEGLVADCYTGPAGSLDVGICQGGQMLCEQGQWGGYPSPNLPFIPDFCSGETLPLPEDLCSDQDENCDGLMEKVMEDTDILFIVDGSGSMNPRIMAVVTALSLFSQHYEDQQVIQWGLVMGPSEAGLGGEHLYLAQNLTDFDQFFAVLMGVDQSDLTGGSEMLLDALYLSLHNLPGVDIDALQVPIPMMTWQGVGESIPPKNVFEINWRDDTNHVVILFSDEIAQTFLEPGVTSQMIQDVAAEADDLAIYPFSLPGHQSDSLQGSGWGPLAIGGSWWPLSSNAPQMFSALMQILDETACGEGPQEQQQEQQGP